MNEVYRDIPRLYTALAQWGACLVYCLLLKPRFERKKFWVCAALMAVWQSVFLYVTGNAAIYLWIPCMAAAVAGMYLFLWGTCQVGPMSAGYYCARAFLLAEFAASLEWQLDYYIRIHVSSNTWYSPCLLAAVCGLVFYLAWRLEKMVVKGEFLFTICVRELGSAWLIVLSSFAFSNLSFVYQNTPFSSRFLADVFNIRTLVDLGGMAVLYAFESRIYELQAERELLSVNLMLKSQYDRYRQYQESIDLIHMKYHDLKHQIAGLRAETDAEKRGEWLDAMEKELELKPVDMNTGNHVLDTILTGKAMYCAKQGIQLTCVADGSLLNFLHVTDICSIFGNALDNAIESVITVADPDRRLIHLSLSAKKEFVWIQVENYCEHGLTWEKEYPVTTKKDRQNHGFGLKSIRYAAEKYGGSISFGEKNNWFQLNILIPRGR